MGTIRYVCEQGHVLEARCRCRDEHVEIRKVEHADASKYVRYVECYAAEHSKPAPEPVKDWVILLVTPNHKSVPFGPYTLDEAMEVEKSGDIRLGPLQYTFITQLRTLGD